MKKEKYRTYSINEEVFREELQDIFEIDLGEYEAGEHEIYISDERLLYEIGEFFHVENLVEMIQENAYEEVGEVAEDYLDNIEEHKGSLKDHISKWFEDNEFTPRFWTPGDYKKAIAIVTEDGDGNFEFSIKEGLDE